jgi:hypothetical protein
MLCVPGICDMLNTTQIVFSMKAKNENLEVYKLEIKKVSPKHIPEKIQIYTRNTYNSTVKISNEI